MPSSKDMYSVIDQLPLACEGLFFTRVQCASSSVGDGAVALPFPTHTLQGTMEKRNIDSVRRKDPKNTVESFFFQTWVLSPVSSCF